MRRPSFALLLALGSLAALLRADDGSDGSLQLSGHVELLAEFPFPLPNCDAPAGAAGPAAWRAWRNTTEARVAALLGEASGAEASSAQQWALGLQALGAGMCLLRECDDAHSAFLPTQRPSPGGDAGGESDPLTAPRTAATRSTTSTGNPEAPSPRRARGSSGFAACGFSRRGALALRLRTSWALLVRGERADLAKGLLQDALALASMAGDGGSGTGERRMVYEHLAAAATRAGDLDGAILHLKMARALVDDEVSALLAAQAKHEHRRSLGGPESLGLANAAASAVVPAWAAAALPGWAIEGLREVLGQLDLGLQWLAGALAGPWTRLAFSGVESWREAREAALKATEEEEADRVRQLRHAGGLIEWRLAGALLLAGGEAEAFHYFRRASEAITGELESVVARVLDMGGSGSGSGSSSSRRGKRGGSGSGSTSGGVGAARRRAAAKAAAAAAAAAEAEAARKAGPMTPQWLVRLRGALRGKKKYTGILSCALIT